MTDVPVFSTADQVFYSSLLYTYLSTGLLFSQRKLTNQTAAFLWAFSEVDAVRGGGSNKYNSPLDMGFGKQLTSCAAGHMVPKQGRSQREASLPRDAGHVWPWAQRSATCQNGGESQALALTEAILFIIALEITGKTWVILNK